MNTQEAVHNKADSAKTTRQTIKLAFRFDDYATSSNTPLEQLIISEFRKIGATITFGVIPFEAKGYANGEAVDKLPLSDEKANILIDAMRTNTVEVALHGYIHASVLPGQPAEFRTIGYNIQKLRLLEGKSLLESKTGTPVTTFVPPWNEHDDDTLAALESTGFKILSARIDAPINTQSKLALLPATSGILNAKEAVEAARHQTGEKIIVILFHEYDFVEIDNVRGKIGIADFVELMEWIKSQNDLEILSLGQIAQSPSDLSLARYNSNFRGKILARLLPERWVVQYDGFYHDGGQIFTQLALKTGLLYGSVMISSFILSFLFTNYLASHSMELVQVASITSAIFALLIVYRAFRYFEPFKRGVTASALAIGASVGCITSSLSF